MLVVGPEIPEGMRTFALSVVEAIRALQVPQSPVPVLALTAAELPPAANYPNCVVRVSDLDILAVSNGSEWVRQDTGASV